jgi:YhcH/YjgK/YiaL family protein
MIIDRWDHAGIIGKLGPGFVKALSFIEKYRENPLPCGRYDIDGDDVYAMVQTYTTKPAAQKKIESHQKYADLQYVAQGAERMGYVYAGKAASPGEYNSVEDYTLYEGGDLKWIDMREGDLAIFFPHDAHMPGVMIDRPEDTVKIVVKIRFCK